MQSRAASRLLLGFFLSMLTATFYSACGSRNDLTEVGGGGSGSCSLLGKSCGDGALRCCGELECASDGKCKPSSICSPNGVACTLTTDCCALDCLKGFCGGTECKPQGS